jgi:prophage antirepressor-like protein
MTKKSKHVHATSATAIVRPTEHPIFDFHGHPVRTAGTWERPIFCAADVCAVLGIENVSDVLSRLDPDDIESVGSIDPTGKTRQIAHVTESGLYQLILGSRKPQARAFKRWVTGDVLPAIRLRGHYSLVEAAVAKERDRLLEAHFPELPGPTVPLFSDLIEALLRRFGWVPTRCYPTKTPRRSESAPPWAKRLAEWVYEWAIRVDGQQKHRRIKNPAAAGGSPRYPDHSMFAGATKDAVREVLLSGVAIARSAASWEDWRMRMELAYGTRSIQTALMVPMLAAREP